MREECPGMPILIPGVGAQGGDVAAAIKAVASGDGDQPFLLSSSRAIVNASSGPDFTADDLGKILALSKPLGKLLHHVAGE